MTSIIVSNTMQMSQHLKSMTSQLNPSITNIIRIDILSIRRTRLDIQYFIHLLENLIYELHRKSRWYAIDLQQVTLRIAHSVIGWHKNQIYLINCHYYPDDEVTTIISLIDHCLKTSNNVPYLNISYRHNNILQGDNVRYIVEYDGKLPQYRHIQLNTLTMISIMENNSIFINDILNRVQDGLITCSILIIPLDQNMIDSLPESVHTIGIYIDISALPNVRDIVVMNRGIIFMYYACNNIDINLKRELISMYNVIDVINYYMEY